MIKFLIKTPITLHTCFTHQRCRHRPPQLSHTCIQEIRDKYVTKLNLSYISTIKMSTAQLNPRPVRVSPLIKFGRWSFLGAGILWGIYHQNRLAKREVGIREVEAREKIIRDTKLAEEKKRLYEAEVKMLEDMSK